MLQHVVVLSDLLKSQGSVNVHKNTTHNTKRPQRQTTTTKRHKTVTKRQEAAAKRQKLDQTVSAVTVLADVGSVGPLQGSPVPNNLQITLDQSHKTTSRDFPASTWLRCVSR